MKLSVCTANYGHEKLDRILDRATELGFNGVELTVMYHAIPEETDQTQRKHILARARENHLEIGALHFIFEPGTCLTDGNPEHSGKAVTHLNRVTDLAADLESPVVVFGGGGARSVPAGADEDETLTRVRDVLAQVADHAERAGVTVVYEALNRYETNLGCTLEECRRIIEPLKSPALKVMGDTFHMNIEELSLGGAIRSAGSELGHVHLADSHRLAPGRGHIDFREVVHALKAIGYPGYASFELFYIKPGLAYLPTYEACDEQVRLAIQYLRALE